MGWRARHFKSESGHKRCSRGTRRFAKEASNKTRRQTDRRYNETKEDAE